MLIFLYGPDTYRSRRKLNEIIDYYQKIHKSGLNLKFFEGKELNFEDFKDELQQASMFREKKLMVLTNVFLNSTFKEKFLKAGENFVNSADIILFYEKDPIQEKASLFNFLIKHAKSQEFKLLEDQKLKNWIKKEFQNYQAKITPEALNQLINFVGDNLWQMSNEIKKLVAYAENKKIGAKDVELLVKPKIETDIFGTIDALASKNKKRALRFIRAHLEKGDSPHYLFSMINFQFRNLLIMKPYDLKREFYGYTIQTSAKQLGVHPYVAKKAMEQARKFSFDELKKIYRKIFQIDLAIKTGKIEPETALDLFVAEI